MEIKRFDSSPAQITRNDDGSLSAMPVVTRAGIFLYRRADGTVIRELRHSEEVMRSDSLDTMKMIPVTNGHPDDFINSENAKSLSIGFTGENVKVDGKLVSIPIKISTFDGIDSIERGRLQLSLGYTANVVDEAGVYDGQPYDTRQTDIKYNHLAIVDEARAGRVTQMKLDGLDGELVVDGDNNNNDGGNMSENMAKIRLDKADYEIPVQVESHISKLETKISDGADALESKQGELDGVQGKLDAANDEIKSLKADSSDEKIQARVDARVALLESAKAVCGDEIKTDMSDLEIKKAVILKVTPEAKVDGKSDEYLTARFDSAIEVADKVGVRKQADEMKQDKKEDNYVSRADAMKNGTYEPKTGSK
jgi:hypothetical protein